MRITQKNALSQWGEPMYEKAQPRGSKQIYGTSIVMLCKKIGYYGVLAYLAKPEKTNSCA